MKKVFVVFVVMVALITLNSCTDPIVEMQNETPNETLYENEPTIHHDEVGDDQDDDQPEGLG